MPAPALKNLKALLPANELSFAPAVLAKHAGDKWFASHTPDAVAFPRSTNSVSTLLRFANRHRIPVTARGAGHGYVGGCVPVQGGIVLSLARMNRIKEINAADFIAVVQAGVNTQKLQDEVEKQGLFYPPDPASKDESFIGGNIVTNAGGPRCLKYGVTRDYVLGLEVVLADGSVVRLGGRTHKNKTGFELHRLFVGSEGLLGVVTEATLKLLPLPPYRACLAVGFGTMRAAVRSLHAILGAGFLPCALELADAFTLAAAYKRTSRLLDSLAKENALVNGRGKGVGRPNSGSAIRAPRPALKSLPTQLARLRDCRAHLIVELDGQPRSVRGELRDLQQLVAPQRPLFIEAGLGKEQCEAIWQIRREFSYALRDTGLTKLNEDIVVPRGRLEDLFDFAARLQKKHQLEIACFGHAGDGNIHTNVMVDFNQPGARARSEAALDELFAQVIAWGGAITGEHGIGLAKQRWFPLALSKENRQLHRTIKQALDPHGILNPGKFV